MKKSQKKFLIAGNWKMNKNPTETKSFFQKMSSYSSQKSNCEIVVCVPFVDLYAAIESSKTTKLNVGAQNCHWEKNGAFTGEVSADMLSYMGVTHTIIGHSERRLYFGETDDTVNNRIHAAVSAGLKVILCVGENLVERENNVTTERLSIQVKLALKGITEEQMSNIIIAYEPIWAIGTGKTATANQADLSCSHIRSVIKNIYGEKISSSTIIQYGGSMNSKNAHKLLSQENIDGGLIGGASLEPDEFLKIIKVADSV